MSKAKQFIRDYTSGCSNELTDGVYHEWLTPEQAFAAVEITREEMIDKACEWLLKNDSYAKPTELLVRDFRKAMEE